MNRIYLPRGFDYRSMENSATTGFLSPAQLSNHLHARVRCSVTAGIDLALMRSRGLIGANTPLKFTGAQFVDDRGSDGNAAAHAIPCSLWVPGRGPLHKLAKSGAMQEFIANPYSITNVLPVAANRADTRAEGYRRSPSTGPGLVRSFYDFACRAMSLGADSKGRIDIGAFNLAYLDMIADYTASFEYALKHYKRPESGRVKFVPGEGNVVDPSIPYTEAEFMEDMIQGSLNMQHAALQEVANEPVSRPLIEQAEADFHAVAAAERAASKP